MKQNHYRTKNRQNAQFNQRLTHLQSVVGLANWSFTSPSSEQINAFEQRGRHLIARDNAMFAREVKRQARIMLTRLGSKVVAYWAARRNNRQLATLDDHMLKDIGISRADVMALTQKKVTTAEINAQRFGEDKAQPKPLEQPSLVCCTEKVEKGMIRQNGANDPLSLPKSA